MALLEPLNDKQCLTLLHQEASRLAAQILDPDTPRSSASLILDQGWDAQDDDNVPF